MSLIALCLKIKSKTQPFIYCGRLKYFDHDPETSKPVHMVFQAIDYDGGTENEDLINLYSWDPKKIGGSSSISQKLTKKISSSKKKQYSKPNKTERKGLVTSRVGQGYYRQELLKRWDGKCSVTNHAISSILIASHIVPWSEAKSEDRTNVGNGLLLIPNLDALFDKYLISFRDNGNILISKNISASQQRDLGIDKKIKLRAVFPDMRPYLKKHREKFYQKAGLII